MDKEPDDREVLIEGKNIHKDYRIRFPIPRTVEVLKGADIRIRKGEITGIVGENGSGKSTLMKILVGELEKDKGEVVRKGSVGWCPQELRLYERLTVNETFRLFGEAYGLPSNAITRRKRALAERLDFSEYLNERIDRLSEGNKQKVNLGVSLMHSPDVLLLDEPYTGFDWSTYEAFWEMSEELVERGTAVAIISHIIEKEEKLDRIYELQDGKLKEVKSSRERVV